MRSGPLSVSKPSRRKNRWFPSVMTLAVPLVGWARPTKDPSSRVVTSSSMGSSTGLAFGIPSSSMAAFIASAMLLSFRPWRARRVPDRGERVFFIDGLVKEKCVDPEEPERQPRTRRQLRGQRRCLKKWDVGGRTASPSSRHLDHREPVSHERFEPSRSRYPACEPYPPQALSGLLVPLDSIVVC